MDAVFRGFDDFARFGDLACAELKRQGLQVFDQLRRRPPAADGPSVPALATRPSGSGSRHWKPSYQVQDLLCRRGMSGRTARTCCDAGTAKLMLTGSRKPLLHQSGEARLRLGSRMPCGQRRSCDLTPQPACASLVDLVDAVEAGGEEPAFQLNRYEHADRKAEPSYLSIADTRPFGHSTTGCRLKR
jgi:hypothetical protein